jgi:hypothetical protein
MENRNVGNYTQALGTSMIPTVVGNLGAYSSVRVDIINSGNMHVTGELVVGMKINEGELLDDMPDAALISEIVKGGIGLGASVDIRIRDSANVELFGNAQLWIGKGTLIQEIVNVEPSQRVENVCVKVDMKNVANVEQSAGTSGALVYIRDGQLDDETLDLPSSDQMGPPVETTGCKIDIEKENVANVKNVMELQIWDGELSDETVDVGDLVGSKVEIDLDNVGNAKVTGYLRIVDGELVDEVLDTTSISGCDIDMELDDVGNAYANTMEIIEGELVDELVDVELSLQGSSVEISADNVANAYTSTLLTIADGELQDEVLDVSGNIENSDIEIELEDVANARCRDGGVTSIIINNGTLIDEVVDVWEIIGSRVIVELEDSANAHAASSSVSFINNSTLMDATIDQSVGTCEACDVSYDNSGLILGGC